MIGGNQNWYNFKTALVEHFSCGSSRHGGQEHFKALQHAIKEKKIKARNMDVNTSLMSAAVQVCKIKAASMAYESMVVFISSCGAVGNIGHGR